VLPRRRLLGAGAFGLFGAILPLACTSAPAQAVRSFYVAPEGSDSATGTRAAPFRTIARAVQELRPGDEVVVLTGTYTEQVVIERGGTADAWVTLRAERPGAARVRPWAETYSTLKVMADYVVVDGFDSVGGTGHAVDIESCHHVTVRNCIVHDSGGAGVGASRGEFIVIENNVVYNNCAINDWHTSGIGVYQCRNLSGDTTTPGFRCIVRNNIAFANMERWSDEHTDGNGIIIDDFQSTQTSGFPNYTYPTLVENNLSHSNGGKGVHVFLSDNVTVRNNTCWRNNLDPNNPTTWRPELSNANSLGNLWINNIGVADPGVNPSNSAIGNNSFGGVVNSGTAWHHNLTFNGTAGDPAIDITDGNAAPRAADGNLLGVDPRFVRAAMRDFDFRLAPGSPAIDAGTADLGLPSRSLDGQARVQGTVDIGAYEQAGKP
jgi:serralysin